MDYSLFRFDLVQQILERNDGSVPTLLLAESNTWGPLMAGPAASARLAGDGWAATREREPIELK
jgi:hypothetical protein